MATYNNIISRTDAQALMPEEVSNDILNMVATSESAALKLFKHIPMSRKQTRMPVISALPTAYFVDGDTGLKQTTEVDWTNKYLNAEPIACIVPIPEDVLDDVEFSVWDTAKPLIAEAVGRALDAAVFFGTNIPGSWPTAIVTNAVSAGNNIVRTTASQANGSLAADISDLWGTVEADGFDVNGAVAVRTLKGKLRNARNTQGEQLEEINQSSAYGTDITYPMRGLWPTGSGAAEMVAGDFSNGILGVRSDISWKILTEATIFDGNGDVVYALAQQDMVALRVVARYAYQVANVINRDQPTEGSRFPFGVLQAP